MTPARERCYAALEAYDEVANAMCHIGARRDTPAVERTLRELGAAMNALYGPLPEPEFGGRRFEFDDTEEEG